ncbi:TonB family protein [Mucilaginibacter sp.]|uniref:TonB family protein n=1 Tax=Mucilaginibacter sp. TaxID=1882438 RepID=UPI0025E37966|nr:TonB family protein [Mucilaginibacter sp.]
MNWLHYLLEANIYLGVFYALYFLLLDRETYYKLNRAYLLCTPVLSYIIPLVQVGWLKSYEDGGKVLATIVYNPHLHQNVATPTYFTWQNVLVIGYVTGAVVMLTLFALKISQLLKLTRTQQSLLHNKYKLVKVEDANTAFSFFNYVFIGTNVSGADTMIRHELVHIDQKHSVDIVFLELVKIINWFNPFIYLLQRSLKTVHEYIADEQTAAYENDTLTYSSFLVSNAYGLSGSSISNSFFNYNLLKKRIIMLNQKRSGNLARLKYLAALPVCAGLLCASTLGFSKTYGLIDLVPQKTTDTIKKLKLVDVKPSKNKTKVKRAPNVTFKDTLYGQKEIAIKDAPASAEEITIDPVRPNGKQTKNADLKLDDAAPIKIIVKDSKSAGLKLADAGPIRIKGKLVKSADVKIDAPQPAPVMLKLQKMPPPPMEPIPPVSKDFENLFNSMRKTIRYPALAREGNIVGSVVVKFNVNYNHNISDVVVLKGVGNGCDEEVVRAVKAFTGSVEAKSGNYKMAVSFALDGIEAPKPASEKLFKDPSFAGEVVVVGYPTKK